MVLIIRSCGYSRKWVWNLRTKLCCIAFGEVKCKQGFTAGIWYYLYNALCLTVSMCISGLLLSESQCRYRNLGSIPGRRGYEFTFQFFEDSNKEIMGREQKEEPLWYM